MRKSTSLLRKRWKSCAVQNFALACMEMYKVILTHVNIAKILRTYNYLLSCWCIQMGQQILHFNYNVNIYPPTSPFSEESVHQPLLFPNHWKKRKIIAMCNHQLMHNHMRQRKMFCFGPKWSNKLQVFSVPHLVKMTKRKTIKCPSCKAVTEARKKSCGECPRPVL